MKPTRFLPPLLAGATLILLGANAIPSVHRRHMLREERERLVRKIRRVEDRKRLLAAEIEALERDPFYLERTLLETWGGVPEGAVAFYPDEPRAGLPTLD